MGSKDVLKKDITFKNIFWIFVFGCFFGFVLEMFIHFLKYTEIVSRQGLIYGPFNQVYGIGAVILSLFLGKQKNPFMIFLLGALLGGGIEYFCSFFQELFFKTTSWNYSNYPLNIYGRTSLFHVISWGILALLYIKFIYPYLLQIIEKISIKTGNIITIIFVIFIVLDCLISFLACFRWNERRNNIEPSNKIEVLLDKYYPNEKLEKIYNNAKIVKK